MTRKSAPTAGSGPAPSSGDADEPAVGGTLRAPGAVVLALVALGWLAAMVWSARGGISATLGTAVTVAAVALPVLVSAALVAGAAVGLLALRPLDRRGAGRTGVRLLVATGAGLLLGLAAALVLAVGFGDGPTAMVLAGTTAAAATVGGVVAGAGDGRVVGAVVCSGLAVIAVVSVLNRFQSDLLSLLGLGDTQQSQLSAFTWLTRGVALVCGLVAGLVAFGYLRWTRRRPNGDNLSRPAPAHLLAGAGPGLLLLIAEVLTRTAGAPVLRLAGAVSEADRIAQNLVGAARVNTGLIVLFVGAFTALVAYGRTLGPTSPDPAPDTDPNP
jgi:hypothetical protein